MDFDTIIKDITKGLSGDTDKDIKYLMEQSEKYKNHELLKEILRACGRMMFELLSDEDKEQFDLTVRNDVKTIEATIEEIEFNLFRKNIETANRLCQALLHKIEDAHVFEDDAESEYFTFDEFFEEALYGFYNKPDRTLRRASVPYSTIYQLYGGILVEQKLYKEAREALEKARKWNPASVNIAFEYMETFKALGEWEVFARLTRETFKYAFKLQDIARCHRNLGYYFTEKGLYHVAAACYLVSLRYDSENRTAMSELYYITTKAGEGFKMPELDEIKAYAKEYDFPLGVNEDVIKLASYYGYQFEEAGQKDGAAYCYAILYNLTGSEEVKEMIEKIVEE